jgi:hypothetical protein
MPWHWESSASRLFKLRAFNRSLLSKPIRARLIPINAPAAETARWKRCVPRLLPIYAQASSD